LDECSMIRELPVKPVVAPLATLPINVLLAVAEDMVEDNRQRLLNRMAAALLGDWSRINTVLNLHIWTPGSDEEPRSGSLAKPGTSYTRELSDDVVRTSRFIGLPDSDDGKPDEAIRYDVVHCISRIGSSFRGGPYNVYPSDYPDPAGLYELPFCSYNYPYPVGSYEYPLMSLGSDISRGTLRAALVRCGAHPLTLQALRPRHIGKREERLAEFVA